VSEGRIFISYRRSDTDADANALYQTLGARFGDEAIFKDVDDIPLGTNFRVVISDALAKADVMIALIGPGWRGPRGSTRRSLLDRDDDFVRVELETAIAAGTPIIPIVVRGAEMPTTADLPESCRDFAFLNAAEVEHRSWRRDVQPVIAAVEHYLSAAVERRERYAAGVADVERAIERGDWEAAESTLGDLRELDVGAGTSVDALAARLEETRAEERRAPRSDEPGEAATGITKRKAEAVQRDVGGPAQSSDTDDAATESVNDGHDREQRRSPQPVAPGRGPAIERRVREREPDAQEPKADMVDLATRILRHRGALLVLGALLVGAALVVVLATQLARGPRPPGDADEPLGEEVSEPRGIDVGGEPGTPAVADGKIWVPNSGSGSELTVIDAATHDVIDTIDMGAQGVTAVEGVGSPAVANGKLWVPDWGRGLGELTVIDAATQELIDTIRVGAQGVATSMVGTPAIANGKLWVPASGLAVTDGRVTVIDAETHDEITELDVGGVPGTPAVANGKVWVPGSTQGLLTVIDADTNGTIATIATGSDPRVAATPAVSNGKIWIPGLRPSTGGLLTIIDADTNDRIATIDVSDVAQTPAVANDKIWVPNHDSASITVIDTVTNDVITTIGVGAGPVTPAVANDKIWVPNHDSASITVIDTVTNDVITTVGVGAGPVTPAVADDKIWVPNHDSASITVIDTVTNEAI